MITIHEAIFSDVASLITLNSEVQSLHIDIAPNVFCEVKREEVSKWFETLIEDNNTQLYVAKNNINILGYLINQIIKRPSNPFMLQQYFAYIDHVCVSSEHRGKGIGRKLMSTAIDFAKVNEISRLELDVWTENINAINAYKKIGFKASREKLIYKIE